MIIYKQYEKRDYNWIREIERPIAVKNEQGWKQVWNFMLHHLVLTFVGVELAFSLHTIFNNWTGICGICNSNFFVWNSNQITLEPTYQTNFSLSLTFYLRTFYFLNHALVKSPAESKQKDSSTPDSISVHNGTKTCSER